MRHRVKNARFWVYWGLDWVKITLRPGQELTARNAGWTGEGWFEEGETWTHEGDRVFSQLGRDESDCDGRHNSWTEYQCPIQSLGLRVAEYHLEATGETIRVPDWQSISAGQRDHFAESMGY